MQKISNKLNRATKKMMRILSALQLLGFARYFSAATVTCAAIISHTAVAQPSISKVNSFELAQIIVQPGEQLSGKIPISAGSDGVGSFIPMTITHGVNAGPVLTLIAGIHGSEYAPIMAMQRLPELVDANALSGTLIVVHVANMPAFRGRSIYVGPGDLKNLNRSFPGDADGTITGRIAHTLTQQIMVRSDYLIDVHAGDGNEKLRPSYSAYYAEAGGEAVVQESKRIAVAFGLGTIVQFAGSYDSVEDAIYTSAQAVTLGIPAIDVESGELGRTDGAYVDPIITGALNVMRELNMIAGEPDLPPNPLFIRDRARVYSAHDGIWHADELVQSGDYVSAGTRLGVITDYFGTEMETITAPASGILLILFGTPPVNKGDNIVVIGRVPSERDNQ
ncbi:MAG: succinylglutamate desuccinylase [Gammaproteobacteria bacterium]|nr:succinylglutamate desuccinylase [Gammaproteobacteria bacterium]